jgi:hypothetical protein
LEVRGFSLPGGDELINSRLAYVSVSRGRHDAQIYTNDAEKLDEELSRDVSKQSAIEKNGAGRGNKSGAQAKVPFQYPGVWRRPKSTVWAFYGQGIRMVTCGLGRLSTQTQSLFRPSW